MLVGIQAEAWLMVQKIIDSDNPEITTVWLAFFNFSGSCSCRHPSSHEFTTCVLNAVKITQKKLLLFDSQPRLIWMEWISQTAWWILNGLESIIMNSCAKLFKLWKDSWTVVKLYMVLWYQSSTSLEIYWKLRMWHRDHYDSWQLVRTDEHGRCRLIDVMCRCYASGITHFISKQYWKIYGRQWWLQKRIWNCRNHRKLQHISFEIPF